MSNKESISNEDRELLINHLPYTIGGGYATIQIQLDPNFSYIPTEEEKRQFQKNIKIGQDINQKIDQMKRGR